MYDVDGCKDGYNIQYYQERLYNLFVNSIKEWIIVNAQFMSFIRWVG